VPTTAPAASQLNEITGDRTGEALLHFASNEELRLRAAQHRAAQEFKRTKPRHERNLKMSDLKEFAESFKLKARVPADLLPYLAKDREKQLDIARKAEKSNDDDQARLPVPGVGMAAQRD
jgi:hypothetical protein